MAQPIPDTTFTYAELVKYDGRNSNPIYISLRGTVFDVTKGSDFYGVGTKMIRKKGEEIAREGLYKESRDEYSSSAHSHHFLSYHIFAGHDATKGLAKMSLEVEDLDKDASGLTPEETATVDRFYNLFMTKYVPVGTLVGASRM